MGSLFLTITTLFVLGISESCYTIDEDHCVSDQLGLCTGNLVIVEEDVDCVGVNGFWGSTITSITFTSPDKIRIKDSAFYNAFSLNNYYSNGTASLGPYAFVSTQIKTFDLEGVTDLPMYAFYRNTKLKAVYNTDSLVNISSKVFYHCTSLDSFPFSPSIKMILAYAFADTGFVHLKFPLRLSSYYDDIFYWCTKLETADLTRVYSIFDRFFEGSKKLRKVVGTESIRRVYAGAFSGCTSLNALHLYSSTMAINYDFINIPFLFFHGTTAPTTVVTLNTNLVVYVDENYTKSTFGNLNVTKARCDNVHYINTTATVDGEINGVQCLSCPNGMNTISGLGETCELNVSICLDTVSHCDFCEETGKCEYCADNYFLNVMTSQCVEKCPERFWQTASRCVNCIDNCQICDDTESCELCDENMYFNKEKGACVNCLDTNCKYCDTTGRCNECNKNYQLIMPYKVCILCGNNCVRCREDGTCIECEPNYKMLDETRSCVYEKCPERYYEAEGLCKRCDENCAVCVKNGECEECVSGAYKVDRLNICLESCPLTKYYIDETNKVCIDCTPNCKTCSEINDIVMCSTCEDGFKLIEPRRLCVSKCPVEEYFELEGTCKQCPTNCLQCKDAKSCEECKRGHFYNSTNNVCETCDGTTTCLENKQVNMKLEKKSEL
ncbi:hypothetical protein EIN_092030 [Entamoeba invadens IP1]|uniref:EGF-like domain-containing protein n=1 Tax=Entamoeba invadens IP1 TaxID=370355 RepID=A0A0A1TYT1_ENTIV|nr:hypothetical protein EIN_092030 [Entamoeba invadens IP1]ELP86638.1 hypothetical protein EIN_092030 [Entamoeba invadens IP1]|eukprot:XP_004185984.1 hypothetical protein EIN_092030 [Entamoeba invadens IP1]